MRKATPANGNITIAGVGCDFTSWDLSISQQVDDTTGYSETNDADNSGSGVRRWRLDFTGIVLASVTPGPTIVMGGSEQTAACVLTVDTGCTYTGNIVMADMKISHRKNAGAVGMSGSAFFKLAVTEAWEAS